MLRRSIAPRLLEHSLRYPILVLTGPRQSGKTTLCKALFPALPCVDLESPVERDWAQTDPVAFLRRFPNGAILDEFAVVPALLAPLADLVAAAPRPGRYVLVSSRAPSALPPLPPPLAARTAFDSLLPFSVREAYPDAPPPPLWETLWRGFLPPVFDRPAPPSETLSFLLQAHLERDVRSLLDLRRPDAFFRFLRLAAGRTARPVNAANLAADVGVTTKTALDWLDTLEACQIVRRLPPWAAKIRRRLAKTPKLHFLDTGLACCLLGIRSAEDLASHPLRGQLFESFVVAEAWKQASLLPLAPPLCHYRDGAQREIDLVLDRPAAPLLLDAKSGETPSPDWLESLSDAAAAFPSTPPPVLSVVFASDSPSPHPDARFVPWRLWASRSLL